MQPRTAITVLRHGPRRRRRAKAAVTHDAAAAPPSAGWQPRSTRAHIQEARAGRVKIHEWPGRRPDASATECATECVPAAPCATAARCACAAGCLPSAGCPLAAGWTSVTASGAGASADAPLSRGVLARPSACPRVPSAEVAAGGRMRARALRDPEGGCAAEPLEFAEGLMDGRPLPGDRARPSTTPPDVARCGRGHQLGPALPVLAARRGRLDRIRGRYGRRPSSRVGRARKHTHPGKAGGGASDLHLVLQVREPARTDADDVPELLHALEAAVRVPILHDPLREHLSHAG